MQKSIITFLFLLVFVVGSKGQDLFHKDSVTDVRIYFYEGFDWLHVLDSLKEEREDERVNAKVIINGESYEFAGVRFKGNSSFHSVQKMGAHKFPFNIKTTHNKKKDKLPGGHKRLKLANGFRDPSFIREVLSYEIARKYMPASQSNFAKLYVNDDYVGLYTSSEAVDDAFLENHFGTDDGVLFKCDPNWRMEQPESCPKGDKSSLNYLGEDSTCYQALYELKSDYGWKELMKLTKAISEHSDSLENMLDINQTLWLMAFNNVMVNLDSYLGAFCHNFYLYQDEFGVFHPIIWDLNLSLGGFTLMDERTVLNKEELQELSLFTNYSNEKRPLISVLLKNDLYRKIYVANIKTIVEENFQDSSFHKKIEHLKEKIRPLVEQDSNKLYSVKAFDKNFHQTVDAHGSKIIGITELMDKRMEYIRAHPLMKREAPEVVEVNHSNSGDQIHVMADVKGAEKVYLCYRFKKYHNFKRIAMQAENTAKSEQSCVWSTDISKDKIQHYYIIAEGEKAAILAPRRAAQEFFDAKEETAITNNDRTNE